MAIKHSVNDLSDINTSSNASPIPPMTLPIRGEKRFIPQDAMSSLDGSKEQRQQALGGDFFIENPIKPLDFFITSAKEAFTDYISVTVPHRGIDPKTGNPDPNTDPVYRFLINPRTVQVARNTEDSQTFARGGWQFGVWGEGLVHVTLSGKTPGQYFAYGLTDDYNYLSQSWRNLQQLVLVFENNGYWFEGEEANEGPLAPGFTRRRIKKHQDLLLTVGNFIWSGMFEELSITQSADTPFNAEFRLTFLAWKERFRQGSPYSRWGLRNDVQRGHSYGAYAIKDTRLEIPPFPDILISEVPPFTPPPVAPVTSPVTPSPVTEAAAKIAESTQAWYNQSRPKVKSGVQSTINCHPSPDYWTQYQPKPVASH